MRCITPQITWHDREPVLSIDIDPTSDNSQGFYRLATGGSDSHLLVWHLREADTLKPNLLCVADLTRHQKAVNAVRFSPDGNFIASADDDAFVYVWKNEGKTKTQETWLVEKILRRHLDDIADISWSSDSAYLVSASVDNSAVMWDVKKNTTLYNWSEHNGLVQGVAYDPLGEYVATMCTDRLLRMFNTKTGKLTFPKTYKYPDSWLTENSSVASVKVSTNKVEPADEPTEKREDGSSVQKASPAMTNRLFHDDTLRTFCRRLSFSPKGELLIVPGGILPPNPSGKGNSTPQVTNDSLAGTQSTAEKSKKLRKGIADKENSTSNHGVLVFCRNSFTNPCVVIPTGTSYSIATRFCPVYFEREDKAFTYDLDLVNPTKKSERTVACVGKLRPRKKEEKVLMDMPYKLVYAIATNNSVIIGDTGSCQPIALLRNIHFTRMSDLTWSSDGRILLVSSTDGYCSIISFAENELGIPAKEVPEATPTCFPVLIEAKKKEPKKKEKDPDSSKKMKGVTPTKKKSKESATTTKKVKESTSTPTSKKIKESTSTPATKKIKESTSTPATKKVKESTSTPVSNKEQEPKKEEMQLKAAFKNMEKQLELKQKTEQLASSAPVDNSDKTSPNIVLSTGAVDENVATACQEKSGTPGSKTPKVKTPVKQRNTLDRWIIKTPKTGESIEQKTVVKSQTPLRQSSAVKDSDIEKLESRTSPSGNPHITSAEIDRLEHAPIIVDLDSQSTDEEQSSENLLPSSTVEKEKENPNQNTKKDTSEDQVEKSENVDNSVSPLRTSDCPLKDKVEELNTVVNQKPGEKRPATSPLASVQQKQPRRVQLITLSAPSDNKKTD